MKSHSHSKYTETELNIACDLQNLIHEHEIPVQYIFGSPAIYTRKVNLVHRLAQYELLKKVIEVPGSLIEVGVFQGAGLLLYAKLLEIFCPGDRSKKSMGLTRLKDFLA